MFLLWAMYSAGWILHLAAQCKRSLQSDANALKGLLGARKWLELQAVPLLIRGWLSFAAFVLWQFKIAAHPMAASGMHLLLAAAAGWNGDEALDKFLTLLFPHPWPHGLKIDIAVLVPALVQRVEVKE